MNPPFQRYKLTLSYDGSAYCGWQVQGNGQSIQSVVQKALETVLRHRVSLTGAGRTDAGVHAWGQTAHFDTDSSPAPARLLLALNALLPQDIRVLRVEPVPHDFHARYSAQGKIYHYHLHLERVADPFLSAYRYHVFERIDLTLLKDAASRFVGTKDFTSFANEAYKGSAAHDPVRTLHRLEIVPQPGGVRLEFQGDGFLYKMVRNIAGTLVEVARKKLSVEAIDRIFAARDRRKAGPTLPPHALFLVEVLYRTPDPEIRNEALLRKKVQGEDGGADRLEWEGPESAAVRGAPGCCLQTQ